jgi:uncharacterized protein YdcH (DUF465 family)
MPVDNKTRKQNRLAQYNSILTNGSSSDNPCEYCFFRGIQCIMDPRHRNCAECTRRGRKCAKKFHTQSEWQKVLREQQKIDDEIAQVEQQQLDLMMKIVRLRKQRQFLRTRNDRMLDHDSTVMDQLDEEDPPSTEDLAELDRLADADNAQILAATSENPTLTQLIASANPSSPFDWDSFLLAPVGQVGDVGSGVASPSGPQGSFSPSGNTVEPAGGSPSNAQ